VPCDDIHPLLLRRGEDIHDGVMNFETMMSALFADEDRAREVARLLMDVAKRDPVAAAKEKDDLLAFLRGPMERHMAYEEREVFPLLVQHDLQPEVDVACKHHASLREEADKLEKATSVEDIARSVFTAARLMLHHTNFEGDYIYPELSREEWHALMARTAGGGKTG
jgi:hypothetical protein